MGRAAYRQLGRSLAEMLLPPPEGELLRAVRFEGWDLYESALAQGHGVVCAVAHFGNFELLVRVAPGRGMKLSIIVRTLGDAFSRWLFRSRLRSGVRHLPDRGSTADALAVLRRGEVLAIAINQNMRPSRGIFVDFFGEQACTTPGGGGLRAPRRRAAPHRLSRPPARRHAPRAACAARTRPRSPGHAAVEDLTQQITRALEQEVRAPSRPLVLGAPPLEDAPGVDCERMNEDLAQLLGRFPRARIAARRRPGRRRVHLRRDRPDQPRGARADRPLRVGGAEARRAEPTQS